MLIHWFAVIITQCKRILNRHVADLKGIQFLSMYASVKLETEKKCKNSPLKMQLAYSDRKYIRSHVHPRVEGETGCRGAGQTPGVMEMLCAWISGVVSQAYIDTSVESHPTELFKLVWFIVHKSYLNKVVKKIIANLINTFKKILLLEQYESYHCPLGIQYQ